MTPLTKGERKRIRSQVSCSLVNLGAFKLFWLPSWRRILARSLSVTRHFRVPSEAQLVGEYEHGIPAADIVRDLEELLDRLPEPAPLPEPQPEPEPAPPAGEASAGEAIEAEDRPTPSPSHPWRSRSS